MRPNPRSVLDLIRHWAGAGAHTWAPLRIGWPRWLSVRAACLALWGVCSTPTRKLKLAARYPRRCNLLCRGLKRRQSPRRLCHCTYNPALPPPFTLTTLAQAQQQHKNAFTHTVTSCTHPAAPVRPCVPRHTHAPGLWLASTFATLPHDGCGTRGRRRGRDTAKPPQGASALKWWPGGIPPQALCGDRRHRSAEAERDGPPHHRPQGAPAQPGAPAALWPTAQRRGQRPAPECRRCTSCARRGGPRGLGPGLEPARGGVPGFRRYAAPGQWGPAAPARGGPPRRTCPSRRPAAAGVGLPRRPPGARGARGHSGCGGSAHALYGDRGLRRSGRRGGSAHAPRQRRWGTSSSRHVDLLEAAAGTSTVCRPSGRSSAELRGRAAWRPARQRPGRYGLVHPPCRPCGRRRHGAGANVYCGHDPSAAGRAAARQQGASGRQGAAVCPGRSSQQ